MINRAPAGTLRPMATEPRKGEQQDFVIPPAVADGGEVHDVVNQMDL